MNEQELLQQIIALVLSAMSGNQEAAKYIQQVMQAAQNGDEQAILLARMIQATAQQIQGQLALVAKFGAKLNYIKQLRGECPEGYKIEYFKDGGKPCKRCVPTQKMQEGGETPSNPIDAFKCGRKMKKTKTANIGTKLEADTIQAWNGEEEITKSGGVTKISDEGGIIFQRGNKIAGRTHSGEIMGDPKILKENEEAYQKGLKPRKAKFKKTK